ncbi:leucine-rich repeat-containing protein 14-like [Cinclus cinclus]|uniref:leucine-rich repeat-containing protein 14-like n=1 Tax=Cinclus cinclus TaxID=127875 RepID=UPI002E102ECE
MAAGSGIGIGVWDSGSWIETGIGDRGRHGRDAQVATERMAVPPISGPRSLIGFCKARTRKCSFQSMDSLAFLCARCIVAHHPRLAVPAHLYPILFQVAFLDGRPLVLRDLVATWPFKELLLQRLLGHRKLLRDHSCKDCVQAVIQGVMEQLQQDVEEPGCHSRLRVLDMIGLSNSVTGNTPAGLTTPFITVVLAKACMQVSNHQQKFQRHGSQWHRGRSGAATAAPWPPGMDVHTDLCINTSSYNTVCNGLQAGAASPLRLKCREFKTEFIPASEIVPLLESLDPSCLRRINLHATCSGLKGLLEILPHLLRFPQLYSLKLEYSNVDLRNQTAESANKIRSMSRQLGMLPSLRELNLGSSWLSGNLHQILWDLRAPLESLELNDCSLVPADLAFLSQSFHAPALKILDLSRLKVSQGLLEPLRWLLEKTSASLLHLTLMACEMTDSHLDALIPTLQRCSRLRFLDLSYNPLSMDALRDLLQKTLELPDLQLVVYPEPKECYHMESSGFTLNRKVVDKELLAAAAAEISQLLENSGRSDLVWTYDRDNHRAPDYFSL